MKCNQVGLYMYSHIYIPYSPWLAQKIAVAISQGHYYACKLGILLSYVAILPPPQGQESVIAANQPPGTPPIPSDRPPQKR